MTAIALVLIAGPIVLLLYSYIGYPLLLRVMSGMRSVPARATEPAEWPSISITVPVYNEAAQIRDLLESLLALDYPAERRQILIVSDASDDGTDAIVREYAERGIELLRMPERRGKTAGENAAATRLRGEIVVNTDASIRIDPRALKRLIAVFTDPTIGAASGRDVSVACQQGDANSGEGSYVGYEMSIRAWETRLFGIVGASGCFYAIRSRLHHVPLPDWLSRDFAAAMIAREHGYRTVSVDEAVCFVPRAASLEREYHRKVRTMSRGIETVHHMRHLLNPFRFGWFAWMLFSHKICRWLTPWGGLAVVFALALLAASEVWAAWLLGGVGLAVTIAWLVWRLQGRVAIPNLLTFAAYALAANVAAIHAGIEAMTGDRNAVWEPTRREYGRYGGTSTATST